MSELSDTLKAAKKVLRPQKVRPKYTPEQFKQQMTVLNTLVKVLGGVDSVNHLQKETKKMVSKLAGTFVGQAAKNASRARSSLPESETHGGGSAQSAGREE